MPIINWFLEKISRKKDIYGSAGYMTRQERRRILRKGFKGICVDGVGKLRMSLNASYENSAIIASTGSGKTSRFVINNLFLFDNVGIVATDPAGELVNTCGNHLRSIGYEVKIIDFNDPANSENYNPIHGERCSSFSDLQKFAEVIIRTAYPNPSKDSFWEDSAKGVITIFLKLLKTLPGHKHNLRELLRLIQRFSANQEEIDVLMAEEKVDDDTYTDYLAFVAQEDKIISGVISTCKTALQKVADPNIAAITSGETLHFERIRTEKLAIFLVVPEVEQNYYSFITSLFYSQLLSFCSKMPGKNDYPVFFLIEEAGNLKVPGLEGYMTTLRKRQVSIMLILQDFQQLVENYGKSGASTIFYGGCNTKIYFPGISLQTAQELSQLMGQATVSFSESGFSSKNGGSSRDRLQGRMLKMADELRALPDDHIVLIYKNYRPLIIKLKPWYKVRSMVRKSKIK